MTYRPNNEMPKFDFGLDYINIEGRAIPEDARLAWYPFINELENFLKCKANLTINFKFDFFNTSSMYYLTRIFTILDESKSKVNITINWYYLEVDEDMLTAGEDYKEVYPKLNINLILRK